MNKLTPRIAGLILAGGVGAMSLGLGTGVAVAAPPFCPPNSPCAHPGGPPANWGRPEDMRWRGQAPPWGQGPAPWGWGAPPPPPPHGPLPGALGAAPAAVRLLRPDGVAGVRPRLQPVGLLVLRDLDSAVGGLPEIRPACSRGADRCDGPATGPGPSARRSPPRSPRGPAGPATTGDRTGHARHRSGRPRTGPRAGRPPWHRRRVPAGSARRRR